MIVYDDKKLESFLMDVLPSVEREEIEQRIFADDALFARVEDIETDLVDAYVGNAMTPEARTRFERSLESNPARREKVVFARLLSRKLTGVGGGSNLLAFTRRYSFATRGALAAALLVLVIGAPILLYRAASGPAPDAVADVSMPEDSSSRIPAVTEPNNTDTAATRETTTIATKRPPIPATAVKRPPAPTVATSRRVTFVLSTLTLRSASGLRRLDLAEDVERVLVQLALDSDEFPNYNVDIRDSSGRSIFSALRLPLTTVDGGPSVSFELPASIFEQGRHELVLAGVDERGTEEVAYIDFEVAR
jgi:hypothetical protein